MQRNKKIRLVIDVNIWISTFLSLTMRGRAEVFFDSANTVLVSGELFGELDDAVCKPHLAKQIIRTNYEELVVKLRNNAELIDVHSVVEVCRDPKDNFLLALAKDGNADYLITGDDDLLVLETFEKTKIVKLTDFEIAFP